MGARQTRTAAELWRSSRGESVHAAFAPGELPVEVRAAPRPVTSLASGESPRPRVHRVVVLSRARGAGCTFVASHLVHGLLQQGRSVRLLSAAAATAQVESRVRAVEIVDGSAYPPGALAESEPERLAQLAAGAHTVLAVLSCDEDCVLGLIRLFSVLRQARAPAPFLLVNRFDPRRAIDRRVFAALQLYVADTLLPWPLQEDAAVVEAQSRGRSIYDDAPDSQTTWAMQQLCGWLGARHDRGDWLADASVAELNARR